jgi:hypothetical protein
MKRVRNLRNSSDDILDHVLAPYLYDRRIENGTLPLPKVGVQFLHKRVLYDSTFFHKQTSIQVNARQLQEVVVGRSSDEMLAAFNMIFMAD